jgi:hypothetical protein
MTGGTGGITQITDISGNLRHWTSIYGGTDTRNPDLAGTAGIDQHIAMTTGTRMATRPNIGPVPWTAFSHIGHLQVWKIKPAQFTLAESTSSANYYGLYGGIAGATPTMNLDSAGGAAGTPGWSVAHSIIYGDPPYCNIESLSGRVETDAADRFFLVDLRFRDSIPFVNLGVNGFSLFAGGTEIPGSRTDTYITDGTTTVNSGSRDNLELYAVVHWDTTAITDAAADAIRDAMLADFGIATWDGSSYPS